MTRQRWTGRTWSRCASAAGRSGRCHGGPGGNGRGPARQAADRAGDRAAASRRQAADDHDSRQQGMSFRATPHDASSLRPDSVPAAAQLRHPREGDSCSMRCVLAAVTSSPARTQSGSARPDGGSRHRVTGSRTAPARRVNWVVPGQDHSLRPARLADIESVSGEEARRGGQGRAVGGKIKSHCRRPE